MTGNQPVAAGHHILVEAEEFDDYGGWTLDSQFETEMGSPYLLAHGLGVPVADATTTALNAAAFLGRESAAILGP